MRESLSRLGLHNNALGLRESSSRLGLHNNALGLRESLSRLGLHNNALSFVRFFSRPFGFLPVSLIQVQVVFRHPSYK